METDIRSVLSEFLSQHKDKTVLCEHQVKSLLREMGLPVPEGVFVSKEGMDQIPGVIDIPYPLVAKVVSSKIVSKTEVRGVRTDIRDEGELKEAIEELIQIEYAEGVLIEEMAPRGLEVIIGGIIDEQFGPVVMFGLGGIFVELFRDVAFALAPLRKDDASWLVRQLKGYKLFSGYRGMPPVDMDALIGLILSVSGLISTGLIREIDLNPVILYHDGALILDAKISTEGRTQIIQ
jgi:acetyl-CoA synthetase (ADP-forming)